MVYSPLGNMLILLSLTVLMLLFNSCGECQTGEDGITISLRGKEIPNHGLVNVEDIGVDPNGTNESVALTCSTTYGMCCSDFTNLNGARISGSLPSGNGSWLYHRTGGNLYVRRIEGAGNRTFGISRSEQAVHLFRLHRRKNLNFVNKIWRCVIPDVNGTNQTKYIGIYNETNHGSLSANSAIDIQFSDSEARPDSVVFNLTFITTGGPATTVTWTRDSVIIAPNSTFVPSQIVTDLGEATYSNILTVTGRLPGVYGVSVTNNRTTAPITSNITVLDFSHPIVSVMRSEDLTSINVTWTWMNPHSTSVEVQYEVQYMNCSAGHCDETKSVWITEAGTTHFELLNVTLWAMYNFTVLSRFNSSSIHVLPGLSTFQTIKTEGILAPAIKSVVELADIASVRVTWTQPAGGVTVNHYVVSYRRIHRMEVEEENSFHNKNTSNTAIILNNLEENTTYEINVTSWSGALYNTSDPLQFVTNSSSTVTITTVTTAAVTDNLTDQSDDGTSGGAVQVIAPIAGVLLTLVIALAIVILSIVCTVMYYRRRARITRGKRATEEDKLSDGENIVLSHVQVPKLTGSQEGPVIEEFPHDTTVIEGEEVVFRVVASGYPKPTIQWYHNEEDLVPDYSTEIDQDGSLCIPSSEQQHDGVYKLVATNSSGSIQKEVRLTVLNESEANPPVQIDVDLSPVPVMEFGTYVSNNHKNENAGFTDMYQALDKGDNHAKTVGLSTENKKLNRFTNITVYDDNRIVLNCFQGQEFINACYIGGYQAPRKFIATQGPLPNTVVDFWRLLWQERVPTVVMVTNLKEGAGERDKCHRYWPETGSVDYGPLNVTFTDRQTLADYTVRKFHVSVVDRSEQPLKVTQYHFTSWPDHGVPTYATSILAFHRRIRLQHKPKKGPILVHCSAGVGRTGTFIAIDSVLKQVEREKIVDIAGVVNKMRDQRMKMVQTVDQFMFIHDAILETVTCGDTQITASNLRNALKQLEKKDPKTHQTFLQEQFDVLEQVSPSQGRCTTALHHPDKNRRTEHLPSENHRIILKGEFPDYINATGVDGYKQKRAYIVAEGPMRSTARNFWKMNTDRKSGVIVMLSDLAENGKESSSQYWPKSGQAAKYGEFTITLLDEEDCTGYSIRKLRVEGKKTQPQQVTQFHITNWRMDGTCSNLKTITDVIDNVSIVQRRTGNNPIVVHCHDTVGRSGMFCAIASTIERCKTEGVVDVFQVIKALRIQKPGAVLNVEQYHLVFEAVLTYLDSFDMYANFQDM